MFLAGAADVEGLAGYAFAQKMDETEKMEEASLEIAEDMTGNEIDKTKYMGERAEMEKNGTSWGWLCQAQEQLTFHTFLVT